MLLHSHLHIVHTSTNCLVTLTVQDSLLNLSMTTNITNYLLVSSNLEGLLSLASVSTNSGTSFCLVSTLLYLAVSFSLAVSSSMLLGILLYRQKKNWIIHNNRGTQSTNIITISEAFHSLIHIELFL